MEYPKKPNMRKAENAKEIRKAFIKKFTMTWEEFQVKHKDWIEAMALQNHTATYEERYLWELMDYGSISFNKSLELLRTIEGDVFFMSENENKPNCYGIEIDGVDYKGVVGVMDAVELADLIEYEWYEGWRLCSLDMYIDGVLPDDLYVFDEEMKHLLVFTHENDHWELEIEQPLKAAESRFCMMYGFELEPSVTYEKIREMLSLDLSPDSSLEIEISYCCSMYFRQFVVSKWSNEDNTGYEYWFDFDASTSYASWEDAESSKVFGDLSLKEISELEGVRFDIISINGNKQI
jgi:hypothetical protein